MQTELTRPGPLLNPDGSINQVGWMRQPILDCNLDAARFYALRPFQRFRVKRWDYYAVFSPRRFFSVTIADLGYAGNIFVYTLDFESGDLHEEGLIVPLGKGIQLPRNSSEGDTHFKNKETRIDIKLGTGSRSISVDWPGFDKGKGLRADVALMCPADRESMSIVIPIGKKRFYFNRKVNCMPAEGVVKYGAVTDKLELNTCSGSLDWGRGVWEYRSFWNWASLSGYLPDGRAVGLNMGCGFGDLSRAGENCLILGTRIHKLEKIKFDYKSGDYMKPWKFNDADGRINLVFTPFKDRMAKTNMGIITSEVHQMFGRYNGKAIADDGEVIPIKDLIGFAEEHHAKW